MRGRESVLKNINDRLQNVLHEQLSGTVSGFRKGRSSQDNVFTHEKNMAFIDL